jgi:hypothetical protein
LEFGNWELEIDNRVLDIGNWEFEMGILN